MSDDSEFEPRLGRMRSLGSKRGRKYLHRVLAATALAGPVCSVGKRRFDGSRIGRGASIGRLLGSRDRHAAFRSRRAVVKMRIVRLGGKGYAGARAHLRYIQRDSVTREGQRGELYSARDDIVDGKTFIERAEGDRHQFRFIVSAEDGAEYTDLKPLIRRFMTQMEEDLGTRLDWVAADHFDTGHPHSHIMLRGKDERGDNLIIAREYISSGMRERVAELVALDLGPRTDLEIERKLRHDIGAERVTAIDRQIVRDLDEDRTVSTTDRDPFQQSLRIGRLQKLRAMGLAEDAGEGRWRLAEGFDRTLGAIGERDDIIRTMQRELSRRKLERSPSEQQIYDPAAEGAAPLVGRVIARGLSDELDDRNYLVVDAVDGRSHYVNIGTADAIEPLSADAIVRIAPRRPAVRQADRTVADVAAANGGLYAVDLHLRHDPRATRAFAETHVRRLEAMRRTMGNVERRADGTWLIAPDHLERAAAFETRQAKDRPVSVELLSTLPLDRMTKFDGATWLDRELVSSVPTPLRASGFGGEVRTARLARQQWLLANELAERDGEGIHYRPNMLATLQRRELLRVAGQLSNELGLRFVEAKPGEEVSGTLRRGVDMAAGKFALVEKSREFTLVPWRAVLERQVGKEVGGIMRDDGVSWTFGRQRSGPSI